MGIKVSIVVPVYNVEKYLSRCLDSILLQTMPNEDYEVILVDDGSTDSSGRICDEYSLKCSNFKVIHQKNSGVAAARNAGLDAAAGEYVTFVDSDDYIDPEYLSLPYGEAVGHSSDIVIFDAVKEFLAENAGTSNIHNTKILAYSDRDLFTDNKEDIVSLRCRILYPYATAKMASVNFNPDVPLAAPWDKLYKLSFLRKHGLRFCEELAVLDDMCFNFEAFEKAERISYLHSCLYHYTVNQDSITNSYKDERPLYDMKAFAYVKRHILFNNDLMQAYYARVIKSFAICCRIYFFNKMNPAKIKTKFNIVRKYMDTEPYTTAAHQIKLNNLEWKLRIVTAICRMKMPRLLYLLHVLQNG